MAKPFDQFGGVLRFFYITKWVAAFIGVVATAVLIFAAFHAETGLSSLYYSLSLIDAVTLTVTAVLVITILKNKNKEIPGKVVKLITIYTAIATLAALAQLYLLSSFTLGGIEDPQKELADVGREAIKTLIWAGIWIRYFRTSKRVITYYGLISDAKSGEDAPKI